MVGTGHLVSVDGVTKSVHLTGPEQIVDASDPLILDIQLDL